MAQIKELNWKNTGSLLFLAKGVEKSARASISYLNSESPASVLKMMPSFVTKPVIDESKMILNSLFTTPYTMLLVDVCNYGVKLSLIFIRGCRDNDIIIVGETDVDEAFKHTHSAEAFFGCIAMKCFKFVKSWTKKPQYIWGRTLLCTLLCRFDLEFSSLKEGKIFKFMRNFHIEGCLGRDIIKILNEQLKIHQRMATFRIICTNMTNRIISTTIGVCIHQKAPDVLVLSNRSANFCFLEHRHNIAGHVGENMIIESQINRFGEFVGSDDNNLLRRFLVKSDFDYNLINMDESHLMDKITSSYWMCLTINRYIKNVSPDLIKKFNWLENPQSITVTDVSNLLQYADNKKDLESKLVDVFGCLNQDQRVDLIGLCREFTNRSAKVMAAFTWGIILTKDFEIENGKIVVALEGVMFKQMHGYKSLFKSTMEDLKKRDQHENLQIEYIDTTEQSVNFGVAAISRFIGNQEKGKGFTLCEGP